MKTILFISLLFLAGCHSADQKTPTPASDSTSEVRVEKDSPALTTTEKQEPATFSNDRFKDVTVQKTDATHYRVQGKAQVFEAALSWVVEDGHNEISSGHTTTSAGAPEWGKFDFVIEVNAPPNTAPHLLLFENSAKDGSRQYELPIPLPH